MWVRIVVLVVGCVSSAPHSLRDPPFDEASIGQIHTMLLALKDEIKASLTLPVEEVESLQERLKILERRYRNHVPRSEDSIEGVNARSKVRMYLYQSDIALTRSQFDEILNDVHLNAHSRSKRQAFRNKRYPKTVWQNSRMAFSFDNSASEQVKTVFRKAAMAWMDNTCIDIYEDTCGLSPDRILVSMRDGCWSFVGRIGGEQVISLDYGCESIRNAAHELGHALGLFHTQSRHDRDQYVTINVKNIKEDWIIEFNKESTSSNYNYDVPYDLGSIMHYGSTFGSVDKKTKPTIIPKDVQYAATIGSHMTSFYDYLIINRHYNCTDRCKPESSAKCGMGGFPNPRNCRKCICPGGYGGLLCLERPAGCGQELVAKPTFQNFSDSVGDKMHGNDPRIEFDMCYYWITAPEDKQIEVKILQFSQSDIAAEGCKYGGIEIKTQSDQRLTGYRFCSISDVNTVLISNNSIVPIITFSRQYQLDTVIQYRYL